MVWSLMLLFLVSFVSASCLDISDIDIYVDGKKESGSIDVKPESELELKIKVENTCEDPDIDLEDVTVIAAIYDIDDGDDLEEESDDFDLDAGRTKKITLEFDIPLEVEDGDYDLIIEIEGEQANDSTIKHNVSDDYNIDVEKERHDVRIRRAELDSNVLKCARRTELDVSLINLGTSEEEEVEIKITNSELGLNIKDDDIELTDDPYDDDSKYSESYAISVSDDQIADTYPIKVEVEYDEGNKRTSKTIDLTVEDCPAVVEEPEEVEVVQEPAEVVTTPPVTAAPIAEAETTEEAAGISGLITAIIAIEVLVIIAGILLLVKWVKKR